MKLYGLPAIAFFMLQVLPCSPVQAQWIPMNGPYGGTIMALAVSPDGIHIFAGSFGGGVYRSTDDGAHWTPANRGIETLDLRTIAVSPDGSSVFAGSRDGVYRSTDLGASWSPVNTGLTNMRVVTLAFIPDGSGGSVLLAATSGGGVYRTTDDGAQWISSNAGLPQNANASAMTATPDGGYLYVALIGEVYRSTDRGDNWTQCLHGPNGGSLISIATSPDGSTVCAGSYGYGVFRSTDFGRSWIWANPGLTDQWIECLAFSPDGATVFAGTDGELFRSTNGGGNWTSSGTGLIEHCVLSMAFRPERGLLFAGTNNTGVFLSTDNGERWTQRSNGLSATYVSSIRAGMDDASLIVHAYGYGIFASSNQGAGWDAIGSGIPATSIRKIAVHRNGLTVFAASSDRVYRTRDGGRHWTDITAGLDPTYFHCLSLRPDDAEIFTSGLKGWIYHSSDEGDNWYRMHPGSTVQYISAIAPDREGRRIYAATDDGVLRTTDFGQHWMMCNSGLTDPYTVNCFAYGPDESDIYAGTSTGIFRSGTDDTVWTARSAGGPDNSVFALIHCPDAAGGHVLVAGGANGVFLTSDRGDSWVSVGTGLPPNAVLALAVREGGSMLYAGTSYAGTWRRPVSEILTGINQRDVPRPDRVFLHDVFPNPVSTRATFEYSIVTPGSARMLLLDLLGRRVATLVDGYVEAGTHLATFDASSLPTGQYHAVLTSGGMVKSIEMTVLK